MPGVVPFPLYVLLLSEYTKNGTIRIVVTHKMYATIIFHAKKLQMC